MTQFELFEAEFSDESAKMAQDAQIAVLKAEYAEKYAAFRKKQLTTQKRLNPPAKPKTPNIDFRENQILDFKAYSVSDYLTTDL